MYIIHVVAGAGASRILDCIQVYNTAEYILFQLFVLVVKNEENKVKVWVQSFMIHEQKLC